jgi:hypothetical protein
MSWPAAASKPRFSARPNENSSGAIDTVLTSKAAAIESVASVEPLSTRMISSGGRVWRAAPVSSLPMCSSSLKQRMMSATAGRRRTVAFGPAAILC